MTTPKVLTLAALAGIAILAQTADVDAGSRKFRRHADHGEHYDTVMANYTRRCTDLTSQFERARADMPPSAQLSEASALYESGVAHCTGGARLLGIDELNAAIRYLGVIPRVTF